MNKFFYISYEKERFDSSLLSFHIAQSNWVDENTIIINCSPDYSSRVTQMINHKLSYINADELFEVINLEMPYPVSSQVWDPKEREFRQFERYLFDWVRDNINKASKYLFIDSGTLRGQNFTKVKNAITSRLEPEQYRFASLYLQSDSIFKPDFIVEEFNKEESGGLLFEWENMNNPNWNY